MFTMMKKDIREEEDRPTDTDENVNRIRELLTVVEEIEECIQPI